MLSATHSLLMERRVDVRHTYVSKEQTGAVKLPRTQGPGRGLHSINSFFQMLWVPKCLGQCRVQYSCLHQWFIDSAPNIHQVYLVKALLSHFIIDTHSTGANVKGIQNINLNVVLLHYNIT